MIPAMKLPPMPNARKHPTQELPVWLTGSLGFMMKALVSVRRRAIVVASQWALSQKKNATNAIVTGLRGVQIKSIVLLTSQHF